MDFIYVPWLLHTFLLWYGTCDSDNLVPYFGPLLGVGRKVQIWDCHLGLLLNVVLLWWCRSVLASCPMGYCFAGCYLLLCFVFTSTVFLNRKVLLACLQARPLQERCINDLWLFRLTWRTAWWTPIVGDECQIWFNSLLSLSCCWISRETLVRWFWLYPMHEWMTWFGVHEWIILICLSWQMCGHRKPNKIFYVCAFSIGLLCIAWVCCAYMQVRWIWRWRNGLHVG